MKTTPNKNLKRGMLAATLSVLLSPALVMAVQPQSSPAQFSITAPIEKFTLDSCAAPPSALTDQTKYAAVATGNALTCTATIVLNGQKVTLPANTVITFPATFLTPYETFAYNPLCQGAVGSTSCAETGLAIQDTKRLPDNSKPASYEATITGNVVYDVLGAPAGVPQYIAGLVNITQQDFNGAEGFINYIDYSTGEIRVGGDIGVQNGARVRLNDPVGRFGRRTGPYGDNGGQDKQDVRFAVDDGNPTVTAETGYPLCIPRVAPTPTSSDPLCPETNRPVGGVPLNGVQMHIGSFYMPPAVGVSDPGIAKPAGFPIFASSGNPMQQAPLEVGDYIVYAGTQAVDTNGTYVSAHTITANLGIYTTPGTNPAYTTQEVTIVGVGVANGAVGPTEGRELFKVVGFTTDVARPIDTGFVQVDACDGSEGFARIVTNYPNGSSLDPTGAALATVPLGRFRTTFLKGAALGVPMRPASKEVRIQIQGSQPVVNGVPTPVIAANGLTTGQYTAPVSEYIFAENLGFGGLPIVPNNFEDFPFLAQGHGPQDLYDPYAGTLSSINPIYVNNTPPIQGQLAPWPGSPIPPTANCTATGAGPLVTMSNQTVTSGASVTLVASATPSPGATITSFTWTQLTGPGELPLTSTTGTNSITFTAPTTTTGTTLSFNLAVADSAGRVSTKAVTVTVNPGAISDTLQIPVTPTYRTKDGSWAVNVTGTDNTATVSIEAYNSAGTVVLTKRPMTQVTGSAVWNFVSKTVVSPIPNNVLTIKVTSSKGGSIGPNAVQVRTN
ncbi:MAG: hypothetical protein NTW85_16545 [Methylococcales bacterium]|nr:hypothetical protein [Methylococcales bacterium]